MERFKNFAVFLAAIGMLCGTTGLTVLFSIHLEWASAAGGALLLGGIALFAVRRGLQRFAPQRVAEHLLRKSSRIGFAWLLPYAGNEEFWTEGEDSQTDEDSPILATLLSRDGLARLSLSAKRQEISLAGLENGTLVWACFSTGFRRVLLLGRLGLPENPASGCISVAVEKGVLPDSPKARPFEIRPRRGAPPGNL